MGSGGPAGVVGVLLAGGLARRMGGGDKCLRPLGGRSLLAHVVARAAPQADALVLNANGDPARFAAFGLPVAGDAVPGHAGPLAGVLTGLEWAQAHRPRARWVVSVATDTPFLPHDLVARLRAALADGRHDLACAASCGRTHPVFGLWPVALAPALRRALVEEEVRKIDLWTARYRLAAVEFAAGPVDPFFNANRPEDLAQAEGFLARGAAGDGGVVG
jgi:molybdopterin-guanine dinucleotide biosynthesis protein A